MKPKKLGTIINKEMIAAIKIIDDSKWKTISFCLDTPNALKKEKTRLIKEGYSNLWKKSLTDNNPVPMF